MVGIAAALLPWFWQNRRLLPFRQEPSAYHIWVSEIMLQQTRVSAALPYYERFVAELPDPAALAAELERVAGLAWARIERVGARGRTVTLKVKFADFTLITRSRSFAEPVAALADFTGTPAAEQTQPEQEAAE